MIGSNPTRKFWICPSTSWFSDASIITGVSRMAWRLGSRVESRSATQGGCGVTCTDIATPLPGRGREYLGVQRGLQCTGEDRTCKHKSDSDLEHISKMGHLTRYIV